MLDKDVVAAHNEEADASRACWLCWRRRLPGRGLLLCDEVLCSLPETTAPSLFEVCFLGYESSSSKKRERPRTSVKGRFSCELIADRPSEKHLASPIVHPLVGCCCGDL